MLQKTLRCYRSREVNLVWKKGKARRGVYFLLKHFTKAGQKKALVVISKKACKSAVHRNLLRRRLYTLLAQQWKDLPDGLLLFSFRPGCGVLTTAQLSTDLNQILNANTSQKTKI